MGKDKMGGHERGTAARRLTQFPRAPAVCPVLVPDAKLKQFGVFPMLVVMQAQATEEQVRAVCQKIEALGYRAHSMPGAQRTAIGITGNAGEVEPARWRTCRACRRSST